MTGEHGIVVVLAVQAQPVHVLHRLAHLRHHGGAHCAQRQLLLRAADHVLGGHHGGHGGGGGRAYDGEL